MAHKKKEVIDKKKDIIFKSKAKKPVKNFFKGVPQKRLRNRQGKTSTLS